MKRFVMYLTACLIVAVATVAWAGTTQMRAVGCVPGMAMSAEGTATYIVGSAPPPTTGAGTGGTAGPTYLCTSGSPNCIGKNVTGGGCTSAGNCASWVSSQVGSGNTYNVVTQGGFNNTCASDNSAKMDAALAAAGAKVIYFPAGCYLFSSPASGDNFRWTLNNSIVGEVGALPTIRTNFGNTPLTSSSRSANGKLFLVSGNIRPVVIYGLDLDGNVTSLDTVGGARSAGFTSCEQTDQNDDAIDLNGAYGVTIAGNHIHRFTGTGIYLQHGAGYMGASNVIIDNNTIEAVSWPLIDFAGTGSSSQPGVVITNNIFRKEWGNSNPMGAEGNASDGNWNMEVAYNTWSNVPASYFTTACGTISGSAIYEISFGFSPGPTGGNIFVHDNQPETTNGHFGYQGQFVQCGDQRTDTGICGGPDHPFLNVVVNNNNIGSHGCTNISPCS